MEYEQRVAAVQMRDRRRLAAHAWRAPPRLTGIFYRVVHRCTSGAPVVDAVVVHFIQVISSVSAGELGSWELGKREATKSKHEGVRASGLENKGTG